MKQLQILFILLMLSFFAACGGSAPPPWEVSEHTTVTDKDGNTRELPPYEKTTTPVDETPMSSSTLMVVDTITFREEQVFRYIIDNETSKSVTTRMSITQDNIKLVFEDELTYFLNLNRVSTWDSQVFPDVRVISCNMKNNAGRLLRVIIKVNQNTGAVTSVQIGSRLMSNTSLVEKRSSNDGWHIVKSGENLQMIARRYQLTIEEILDLNPAVAQRKNNVITPGEQIQVAR